tara:strand:- start:268 stop:612 length:345 start_codon:yes stop_codon:yes gene_type:complete
MNIILLSYDGNNVRIIHNNDILDNYNDIFKTIPKVFIKRRKKHYIICYIHDLLKCKFGSYKKMTFVDDNYLNIIDARKITKKFDKLTIIHYTAHSKRKSNESVDDISEILSNII